MSSILFYFPLNFVNLSESRDNFRSAKCAAACKRAFTLAAACYEMLKTNAKATSQSCVYECLLRKFDLNAHKYLTSVLINRLGSIDRHLLKCFESLKELNLSGCKLEAIVAGQFERLINLKRLYLSRCELRVIKKDYFRGLNRLNLLDLKENHIESIQTKAFDSLSELQSLDLSSNQLNLDENIFIDLVNLKRLFIKLTSVSVECLNPFANLVNLKELQLNTDASSRQLSLEGLINLKSLEWSFLQPVKSIDENFKKLNKLTHVKLIFTKSKPCEIAGSKEDSTPLVISKLSNINIKRKN
jgi:Leucine-rich repeat (LRR) protein